MRSPSKNRIRKKQQNSSRIAENANARKGGTYENQQQQRQKTTSISQQQQQRQDATCSCSDTDGVGGGGGGGVGVGVGVGRDMESLGDSEAPLRGMDGMDEDLILQRSQALTVEEVLRRRSRRMKQLARLYRRHYWALIDGLRCKYREFYMKYGRSAWKDDDLSAAEIPVDAKCAFNNCKSKPMALSSYCFNHILSDGRQQLYKACSYVVKSGQTGPVICGTPILKAAVPSLCAVHYQKAEKHIARALKKAGLNSSPISKSAPKFHILISEYVKHIQRKRREAQNVTPIQNVITNKAVSFA